MTNAQPPLSFPAGPDSGPFADILQRWRTAARTVDAGALLGEARSLGIVVPHADDETLGCGGLIAAAAQRGLVITVTILTDGAASHPGSVQWPPARLAAQRRTEALAAVKLLAGAGAQVIFAGAPDGRLAGHPDAGRRVPPADLFVTCWRDDPHPDHRACYDIARVVAQRWSAPLLAFPLWTLTTDAPVPPLPLLRLDVSPQLPAKRAALAVHESQHGTLITDTQGFVLTEELLRLFVRQEELFVRAYKPGQS